MQWSQERIERDGIKETDSTPVKAKNPLSSTLKEPKTAKKRKSSQQKTISFTGDTQNITRAHPDHIITHSLTTIRADVAIAEPTSSAFGDVAGPSCLNVNLVEGSAILNDCSYKLNLFPRLFA